VDVLSSSSIFFEGLFVLLRTDFIDLFRTLSILLCLSFPLCSIAQSDSLKKDKYFRTYTLNDYQLPDSSDYQQLDTSLNTWHRDFYPNIHRFHNWLGNFGSARISMLADFNNDLGMEWNFDQLDGYRLKAEEVTFHQSSQPFTKATYTLGSKREESLNIEHNQNVSRNWNVGVDFRRMSYEGWWLRRKTLSNAFRLYSSYLGKGRYSIFASASYNAGVNEENGGFESLDPRAGEVINLTNASNSVNQQEIYVRQYFKLGKAKIDSIAPDSLKPDSLIQTKEIASGPMLVNETEFHRSFYDFIDKQPNLQYYSREFNLIPAAGNFRDRQDIMHLRNKSSIVLTNGLRLYAEGEFARKQDDIDSLDIREFGNLNLGAEWTNEKTQVHAGLTALGWQSGDFVAGAQRQIFQAKGFQVLANAKISRFNPEMFYQFQGAAQSTSMAKVGIHLKQKEKMAIEVEYQTVDKLNYLDNSASLAQSQQLNVFSASFKRQLDWKKFHLSVDVRYQSISDLSVLKMPELMSFSTLYYEGKWFNGNMLARIGTDIQYGSSFESYAYAPHLRWFYTQSGFGYGAYPIWDVFFTCKVNTGRFFVKGTNLWYANIPGEYFITKDYPLNPFSIKFGFDWAFFN